MPRIPGIRRFFRLTVSPRDVARAVDDELQFHFDQTVRDLMARGRNPQQAREEAERRFGDIERTRARLEAIDRERASHERRAQWWSGLAQDVRYTLRSLRARPGFTAIVVLTLALGVGANATMFGIVDRLLLRPPALLHDPSNAHRVYLVNTFDGVESATSNIGYKRYRELADWTTSFAQTAAFFSTELAIGKGDESAEKPVALVSASFWPYFGVKPALGRFFVEDEDKTPEGAPVAVLGYGYWQTKYAGNPTILGQRIDIGRQAYTIVGVAPRGFSGMSLNAPIAFVPITSGVYELFGGLGRGDRTRWFTTHNMSWMEMLVRRKPGVTLEAASADLTNAYRRSFLSQATHAPLDVRRPHAIAASILRERGPKQGEDSKVATWLVGVSVVVLLIACANVANLLLARALRRRREIAVRVALGVSRFRLLMQLLTESLILAVLGGVAGLMVAQWGGGVLRAMLLPDVEWTNALADPRMLMVAGAAALVCGLLTGLAPALQAGRSDVTANLKAGAREGTFHRSRLRTALLVIQGALSVVLLVGAGLFVRSLHNVRSLDLGYDVSRVLYVNIEMRGLQLDSTAAIALRQQLLDRARALPGVEQASLTATVPFWMSINNDLFTQARDSIRGEYYLHAGSPSYFATMGTHVVKGRGFTDADVATSPRVLVVSQSMAKKLWPDKEAIGQCLRIGADSLPCTTVVGIARDIRRGSLDEDEGLQYYLPITQFNNQRGAGLFVRTRGDAERLLETVRRELQRSMPGSSYVTLTPLQKILDPNVRPWQLGATMFVLFGALALLLAAVGLYSVIAYSVTQRTHEMGVRVALGAQGRDVIRLVLVEGVRVALLGLVIGVVIALVAGRFIAPLLFRVPARDPWTFGSVTLTLLAVAVAASFIPAWRAARVDPSVALRAD